MRLEAINNVYVKTDGTKTKIVPIGNGSEERAKKFRARLGECALYVYRENQWLIGANGHDSDMTYGLTEKDLALFNAYNYLEEGMEMVGYGDNMTGDKGYDYFNFDVENEKFPLTDAHDFIKREHLIYTRRKKVKEGINLDGSLYDHFMKDTESTTGLININGFDVPLPVREPLSVGATYYSLGIGNKPVRFIWEDKERDHTMLKMGVIHLKKKAAKLHAKALISFTKLK